MACVRVGAAELAAVHLDRASERLDRVFEAYVARLLVRHAGDLGRDRRRERAAVVAELASAVGGSTAPLAAVG